MFRTELTIAPQERQLARTARVLTVGSCFADSIGERLRLNKVNALVNPFGTVFQPLALAQLLRAAAGEAQDWQQHVVEARGRWQSFDFHSTIGADSPVDLLQLIQQRVQQVGEFLRGTDLVVLTLGTAWAYRLRETGELVSNLHKLPMGLFEKELLTADEIVNGLAEVHALLRRIKPDIRIVLTVSPVRHLKDTLPLNAVSKSVLRVACHYLSELLPGVSYFPAYELLNDDLRDYRFYASDMLHPSEAAEDYVWDKFARVYFDADFGRFRKEWAAVRQSLTHRPLHEGAPEHRAFLDQTRERLERLVAQGVEVKPELRDVERRLAALPPPRPTRVPEPAVEEDGEERIDIGSNEPTSASLPAEAATERNSESRGRNRRGRGRERGRDQFRPEVQPTAPATEAPATEEVAPIDEAALAYAALDTAQLADEPTEAASEATELPANRLVAAVEDAVALEEVTGYPAKKKKRRSRGGAKRTARKHAARLAAEQALTAEAGLSAELLPPAPETELVEVTPEAGAPAVPELLPDLLVAEQAPLVSAPTEEGVTAAEAEELSTLPTEELLADAPPGAAPEPTAPVRRGTGPAPKKSKVITKSSPVKRPKRASLFKTPLPEPERSPGPEAAAPVTEAPLISSPIIPEALLERPVVAELLENPAATPAPAPAPAPTTPARRGRPRKAAPPTEEVIDAAVEPAPVPEAPAAPPTRARRAARPAEPGPDGQPAPRRGRPPGKKRASSTPEAPTS